MEVENLKDDIKRETNSREKAKDKVAKEKAPPVQALKRFANMLQTGDHDNQMNYDLNQQRISEFLQRTSIQEGMQVKNENASVTVKLPGLYDYSNTTSNFFDKDIHSRFNAPECQRALGPRSRFGDGDGSYWDKWINSDAVTLHTESLVTDRPHVGYKRLYSKDVNKNKKNMVSEKIIQPYALRHAQRKLREANELAGIVETETVIAAYGNTLQAVFDEVNITIPPEKTIANTNDNQKELTKFPSLDSTDRETYFGEKARASFYDFYRQVGRQRYALDDASQVDQLIANAVSMGSASSVVGQGSPKSIDISTRPKKGYLQPLLDCEAEKDSLVLADNNGSNSFDTVVSKVMHDGLPSPNRNRQNSNKGSLPLISKTAKDDQPGYSIPRFEMQAHPNHPAYEANMKLPEPVSAIGSFDPVSPRTKFVVNCLSNDINPKPHLIIRKSASSCLDIGGQGIGDKLAQILAQSLDGLPYLHSLNASNNKLTDIGLAAIIDILPNCTSLTSLNLSENKVDAKASAALFEYLNSPACKLTEIVLNKADIDDNEAGKFLAVSL